MRLNELGAHIDPAVKYTPTGEQEGMPPIVANDS